MIHWPFTRSTAPKVRRVNREELDAGLEPYRKARTLNVELSRRFGDTTALLKREIASGVTAPLPCAGWP